ncbi:MarR family transcriptional regulator [Ligilactobacillus salivarius SMXD51]|uniref:MarR family transcriptional regulator n=1 Tax=Ligilactobacillus salivarius SMXD51 TaxID=1108963 RepID=H7G0T0_9LACO|nr:MarR family transcriptional regulator [Ligilactobacillus salivarius SMXD51]
MQERLEDEVAPRDLAIFKRVLRQATELIAENNPR